MPVAAATIFLGPYPLFCLSSDAGVLHLTFDAAFHEQARRLWVPEESVSGMQSSVIREFAEQVRLYEEGDRTRFSVQIDPRGIARGTRFQQRVWALLETIPPGEARTYGECATALGNRHLSRAVGQACRRNPLALVIPCHRVVGVNGLRGFAGGLAVKGYLLDLERAGP